jgi:DNA-binding LacI/PurR family transcriptional regulator
MGDATVNDVARRAGVSKSTVSNVVRGAGPVARGTRRRVLAAIADLDYRPNTVARALKERTTQTLGFVVPDAANPFFALVGRGVEHAASEAGFAVVLANTRGDCPTEQRVCRALVERRVDGVVFAGLAAPARALAALLAREVPISLASCDADDARIGVVDTDDRAAMELVVAHLSELGHERIAFAPQPFWDSSAERRPAALSAVLQRRGLELLDPSQCPTAICAANDSTAIGLIDALERRRVCVPADVSIVGFDDIALAAHQRISLTTVRQDGEAIGRRAAEIVLAAIAAGRHAARRETAPIELVVRSTTAPPHATRRAA